MTEIDLTLPPTPDFAQVERAVDEACAALGLTTQLKGTLRQYPGCTHWHLHSGKQTGTLEVTLWPNARRLWFKVADNRRAAWIDEAVAGLTAEIENRSK